MSMNISILNVTVMTALNSIVRVDWSMGDLQRITFFPPTYDVEALNTYIQTILKPVTFASTVEAEAEAEKAKRGRPAKAQQPAPTAAAPMIAPAHPAPVSQHSPMMQAAPAPVQPVAQPAPVQPVAQPAPVQPVAQPAPVQPVAAPIAPIAAPAPMTPVAAPAPVQPASPHLRTPFSVPVYEQGLTEENPTRHAPAAYTPAMPDESQARHLLVQGGYVDAETARKEAGEVCAAQEPIGAVVPRVQRWPELPVPNHPGHAFLRLNQGKIPADSDVEKLVRQTILSWIQEALGSQSDAKPTADLLAIFHKVNMIVATAGFSILVNGTPVPETKAWYIHTLRTYIAQWREYMQHGLANNMLSPIAPRNLFFQVKDGVIAYPENAAPFDGWLEGKLPV